MRLFRTDNWLKTPADRDIIARWTASANGAGKNGHAVAASAAGPSADADDDLGARHTLDLPQPPDPQYWEFLALGDTGDADAVGPGEVAPQDAVARELARDAALPDDTPGEGTGHLVVHTGDVIYMTGERRLYDRNFRRPYAPFLTSESTVENLVFRLPFLPVPGNHDYYDLGGWAMWLSRVPIIGAGLRALVHELFAFSVPEGGSDMGRAYMTAFMDPDAKTRDTSAPLPYRPGERTRLPNRYYQFRVGGADFFALDSNTLDAPPPEAVDASQVKQAAQERIAVLEKRADKLDAELRRRQRERDRLRTEARAQTARDPDRRAVLQERLARVAHDFAALRAALESSLSNNNAGASRSGNAGAHARDAVALAERRWSEAGEDFAAAPATDPDAVTTILDALDHVSDDSALAMRAIEAYVALLPDGPERAQILGARESVERGQGEWVRIASPIPPELNARIYQSSEVALDVQRELATLRRRARFRPDDYDRAQLAWLDAALSRSVRERPDAWRIVYLHHPLYTTITNHCERADVIGLRDNILALLQKHDVHLVLSGHSHAFEWFRSSTLPHVGVFVSGGGGQISLRPSLFESRRFARYHGYYESLRANGVQECAMTGFGPASPSDGESGPVYHYLRIAVTPNALTVRPVGVRRLASGAFRREEPMPARHAPLLPTARPPWNARVLENIEVRRDRPPQAHWSDA